MQCTNQRLVFFSSKRCSLDIWG